MLIPSYDFQLFEIPYFSPLQLQEFGIDPYFSAGTPTRYVDYVLNQIAGLTQPSNGRPYAARNGNGPIIPYELQEFFTQRRDNITVYPSGTTPPELQHKGAPVPQQTADRMCTDSDPLWKKIFGICCSAPQQIINGRCTLVSDDSSVGTTTPTGERIGDATKAFFGNLPQGAGVFLVGVVIVILLLLFVRR